ASCRPPSSTQRSTAWSRTSPASSRRRRATRSSTSTSGATWRGTRRSTTPATGSPPRWRPRSRRPRSSASSRRRVSDLVLSERDGAIAVVTLNRPDALNALSDELMEQLVATLQDLDQDDEVRCIVLAGNDKAFAAGADIAELARSSAIDLYYQRRIERGDATRGL